MNEQSTLTMSFDPNVIDDLGAKLYSTLPPILAELIANGYDACASRVEIDLYDGDSESEKRIIISDNGTGMSFADVNDQYLVVGRKKRDTPGGDVLKCNRPPIGKKGLGKLSFFGIARVATIETVREGEKIRFVMDLDKIHASHGKYAPEFTKTEVDGPNGTTITLTGIYRKTDFDLDALMKSMSNYFIFDAGFQVFIRKNGIGEFAEIDNELRYEHPDRKPEYTWNFPETGLRPEVKQFSFSSTVKGKIILFDKPVRNSIRGVTLFSRKKLVNLPEFFPVQGSSFFYQYLTGWLEVDFIDDFEPDVISTNRSNLSWNDDNLAELKEYLDEVIRLIRIEWRKLEAEAAKKKVAEKFDVDPDAWRESNKNNQTITKNIDKLIPLLNEPEGIPQDELLKMFEIVHDLAPEHADFVLWSGLHEKITSNDFIREKFFAGNYLEAAREAAQIYNEAVQTVSSYVEDGYPLMEKSYGKEQHKKIWITDKSTPNEENIDEGQKLLSQGVMVGFKNPAVSHTSVTQGLSSGVFTDRNCLDILSTISYLYTRLEERKKP
jgi:uncharacterized protein (TIGR02391 family)